MNHDSKFIHLSKNPAKYTIPGNFHKKKKKKLTLTNLKKYLIPQQGIVQAPRASENPSINRNWS